MRMIGNEVHIQRGENWSLDFDVRNDKGHPYTILKAWPNPYIAITVAAALYEQSGDYRETYWLDLSHRLVENGDNTTSVESIKKFVSNEVRLLTEFAINDALRLYDDVELDDDSDFDVKNFLFFTDPNNDGDYVYKYVKEYTLDNDNNVINEVWEEYAFRIIKQFDTKSWMEQRYLFDIKILAGESVQEHLAAILDVENVSYEQNFELWSNEMWLNYINAISDEERREEMRRLYDEGAPLMPTYDTKMLILDPTPIYVSVNIQGGVR